MTGETLSGTGDDVAAIAAGAEGTIMIEAYQRVEPEELCFIRDTKL